MQFASIVVQRAGYLAVGDIIELYGEDIGGETAGVYKIIKLDQDTGEAILSGMGSKEGYISTINFQGQAE